MAKYKDRLQRARRGVRILHLGFIDEEGVRWDLVPGWLSRGRSLALLRTADRVLVHDHATREVRVPDAGEALSLVELVDVRGGSGPVCASHYESSGWIAILFSRFC